jgi:hypothetical protein
MTVSRKDELPSILLVLMVVWKWPLYCWKMGLKLKCKMR